MFPLLGATIADGYWGKYKTIKWISLVYALGMVIFAFSSLPQLSSNADGFKVTNGILCCIGLFTIAFGTGGIKPNVASFGGDQFEADDSKNTSLFFDIFYWAVNAGAFFSTLLTPIIRTMDCGVLGTEDACWFVTFIIPAVLMFVAVGLFVFGSRYYKIVPPSGSNILWECSKCIWYGTTRNVPENAPEKFKKGGEEYNWLYGAYGDVEPWLIRDCKYLVRIIVMICPLPIFWAAFDQQGSRWTLQCVRMNGYITNSIHVLPDQAQVLNAIFILTFIPIFNYRVFS